MLLGCWMSIPESVPDALIVLFLTVMLCPPAPSVSLIPLDPLVMVLFSTSALGSVVAIIPPPVIWLFVIVAFALPAT